MMLVLLLVIPLTGAGVSALTSGRGGQWAHAAAAGLTLAAAVAVAVDVVRHGEALALGGLMRADALSAWMIVLVSVVGAVAASDAVREAPERSRRSFYPLLGLFVFTMLLAVTTDDVGLMWVAIEGTTLASVFLVNADQTRASLEASYKYLLICSVGIALAFVGTVLIYFADVRLFGYEEYALRWTTLLRLGPGLPPRVVTVAFVFLLVGYGTKAGLVPMHTWLPDAHSEAPAPVSALMSGVLLSVGLYAVLRFKTVVDLAAGPDLARRLLVALGLLSVGVAAAFLWTPRNFKRMLAYSSIEHLGLACLGLGFGGPWGVAGAMLHVANHALAKSVLFVLAGRIRAAFGSAEIMAVRGLITAMPVTARAFLLAMLALMGLPPFGLFVSEVMIFRAGFEAGFLTVSILGLAFLLLAFGGLLRALHRMLYAGESLPRRTEPHMVALAVPAGVALALLVVTGVAWPPGLGAALAKIATVVGR